jgi:hypothetical protein
VDTEVRHRQKRVMEIERIDDDVWVWPAPDRLFAFRQTLS